MKIAVRRLIREEKGQALVLVLILLLVGGLVIAPLLDFMGTGLKVGKEVYENKMYETYAADAGVEDGLWQIKYDRLPILFPNPPPDGDGYDEYDYSSSWNYSLNETVNGYSVNVTIQNVWMPKDIPAPNATTAHQIIEEGKLIITGGPSAAAESTYEIKMSYAWTCGEDLLLDVNTIGIWLPPGFEYVMGSSDLEKASGEPYHCVPVTASYKGGYAVVWNFASVPLKDFPGSDGSPMIKSFTFQYTPEGQSPDNAVSWIDTSEVPGITYTWDADVKIYKILSVAGDCEVEAYAAKGELRKVGSAIAGDYRAFGNSLMLDLYSDWGGPRRDTLLEESSTTVDDIPSDAYIEAAYLYWSAWLYGGSAEQTIWEDPCIELDPPTTNWVHSGDWNESGTYTAFYGHDYGGDGTLIMKNSLDLSSCSGETVTASWRNWNYSSWRQESTDCLQYGFSADGGSNWDWYDDLGICGNIGLSEVNYSVTIPEMYLTNTFKIGFRIQDYEGTNEYIYIDNVEISVVTGTIADTMATFKVNDQQFYFDGDGEPKQDSQEITASESSVLENKPGTYSYACYLDVTELVRFGLETTTPDTTNGNGKYTVGGVYGDTGDEWSYAGWSLIIIYSSAETQGHQLYLYDNFVYAPVDSNIDFDDDGEDGGTISGFLVPDPVEGEDNAAKITVFVGEGDDYYNWDYFKVNGTALSDGKTTSDVWNSWSLGMSEDGVDIDTFYVTWESHLLEPGDPSAQIDLPTGTDSWNLVYIILSFRSEATSGGSISYLIRG